MRSWEAKSRGPYLNIKILGKAVDQRKIDFKGPMSNVNMFPEQWKKKFRKKFFIGDDDGALAISRIYPCSIITTHRNNPVGGITNTNYFIFRWLQKKDPEYRWFKTCAPSRRKIQNVLELIWQE